MTMLLKLRNRHFFILDLVALLAMPTAALLLRLDKAIPADLLFPLVAYTLVGVCVRLTVFNQYGLYRRYWRYASVEDLLQIAMAVGTATLAMTILFVLARLWFTFAFARSVLLIDGLLVLLFVGGTRFSVRLEARRRREVPESIRRVLIMGAGDAGEMIARELLKYPNIGLVPVGFLDDNPEKQQVRIHNIPVLGGRHDVPALAAAHHVGLIIIAMPTAPGTVIREIVRTCEKAGVETKIIPALHELLNGHLALDQLRDVDIEDLLRREPVQTDTAAVQELIAGKRVLITGGGGSIGGELCRQVLRCGPSELVVLGHGENSVFAIYHELRRAAPAGSLVTPVIADTRFPERLQALFEAHRPQIVFHAAAHKHVPLMELNPAEAITNNVLGTRNILEASLATGVERFVMISTDKAVNPTSVMGASKRVAELLVHRAAHESGRAFVAVRFGNVLGSRGSVVLTFKKQIAAGGPVTVTHPEMKRYFMTIPEAVQLVLQAAVLGKGDELFMLDMGEPVKIVDMARDLITLSGLEVGRDIEITFTGMRPGEKLFEEMFIPGEDYHRTRHEKIFIAGKASSFVPSGLEASVVALEAFAHRDDKEAIVWGLQELVPEFRPTRCRLHADGAVLGDGEVATGYYCDGNGRIDPSSPCWVTCTLRVDQARPVNNGKNGHEPIVSINTGSNNRPERASIQHGAD